jgi:Tfp pilus assembly protein PilX
VLNRLRQLRVDERGFALVIALAVTVVFSMTIITVIQAATSNTHSSDMSKNRISAYSLAEAGIANANALLAAKNPYDGHLLHPQGQYAQQDCANPPANPTGAALLGDTCSPIVYTLDGGTATVWGWLDTTTANWTITSTGRVTRNAFATQPATKTLTVVVHIRARASQQNVTPAWNYVFVKDTTANVCNITIDQTTTLSSSVYTEGNFCFKNSASITETNPADPVLLEVRGKLVWIANPSKGVGQASPLQEVTSAKIGGGCVAGTVDNQGVLTTGTAHTCARPPTGSDYFYVKSGGYSTTAPAIAGPTVTTTDWDNYYQYSTISVIHPCNAGGLAGSNFDGDTTRNNNLVTPFNLTPTTSYTCQTKNSNGYVIGELDWDATNHILSVRGTVFIDGNVTINGLVKYRGVNKYGAHPAGSGGTDGLGGMMVMYVSGTVSLANQGVFCGWNTNNDTAAYTGSTCDFNAWTPGTSMFMFVTGGGVTLNQQSYFQGAIYSAGNVTLGQSAQTEGPLITNTITLGQSVQMKPLPGLADLPLGAPGNPNTSGYPEQPSYTSG